MSPFDVGRGEGTRFRSGTDPFPLPIRTNLPGRIYPDPEIIRFRCPYDLLDGFYDNALSFSSWLYQVDLRYYLPPFFERVIRSMGIFVYVIILLQNDGFTQESIISTRT